MAHLTEAWRGGSSDGRAGWRLRFRYDEDTIERLKATVPAPEREWNPEETWWWVALAQEDAVLRLFPAFEAYLKQGSLF